MSRSTALCGAVALPCALLALPDTGLAQTASRALPPVTVDAPRTAEVRRPAKRTANRQTTARRPAQSASTPAATTPQAQSTAATTLSSIHQSPTGQPQTTVERERFDNRPSFSVGDILRESPGISVKQGNGPRDLGISIRGSNARNGFGIRNMVIFEDGFPVTQPDGLSRSDLIDPHAYGAVDVIRGPSSALFGNYATGGAINFRTRPASEINGIEYGIDGGSFGYLNNYLTAGKKIGNFEASLFASDVRGNGYISNGWFNTQTVNFLSTLHVTPNDRFTVKFINNNLETRLPIRLSLNQFHQNPFQEGCVTGATAALGCGRVTLNNNGFNTTAGTDSETAEQAGLGRKDRRTIVGARWEHDFSNQMTWRNQFVFDDRNISQPTGSTSAIGDFPSYNYMSDFVGRGEMLGMSATTYLGAFYNTMSWSSDTVQVRPGGNATLGRLSSNVQGEHTNFGVRAREELQINNAWTAVAGVGLEQTQLKGLNTAYTYTGPTGITTTRLTSAERDFQNIAPELALLYRPNGEWLFRSRVGTGYGTPQVGNLFVVSNGQNGNNSQLEAQTNVGYDVGFDWTPNNTTKLSVTGFYEFFRNELVTQATPVGAPNSSFTFNAPRSEHRGVEAALDWRFHPGWRFTVAYTYLDQIYTNYAEDISNGAVFRFDRAGNKIPGISPNELTARLGYDEMFGPLKGLGGFVEVQWKDSFYMDNANLLKAPGYELVNVNVHYKTDLASDYLKSLSVFFEVRNVFDKTYVASANNIGNTVTTTGLQNGAGILANTTGSIYAGSPRTFTAGLKLAFR